MTARSRASQSRRSGRSLNSKTQKQTSQATLAGATAAAAAAATMSEENGFVVTVAGGDNDQRGGAKAAGGHTLAGLPPLYDGWQRSPMPSTAYVGKGPSPAAEVQQQQVAMEGGNGLPPNHRKPVYFEYNNDPVSCIPFCHCHVITFPISLFLPFPVSFAECSRSCCAPFKWKFKRTQKQGLNALQHARRTLLHYFSRKQLHSSQQRVFVGTKEGVGINRKDVFASLFFCGFCVAELKKKSF